MIRKPRNVFLNRSQSVQQKYFFYPWFFCVLTLLLAGDTVYRVKAKVEDLGIHYVGWRWEARMVERFMSYEVNGIKGRGVSEFHYHHAGGRQADPTADPSWFAAFVEDTYQQASALKSAN